MRICSSLFYLGLSSIWQELLRNSCSYMRSNFHRRRITLIDFKWSIFYFLYHNIDLLLFQAQLYVYTACVNSQYYIFHKPSLYNIAFFNFVSRILPIGSLNENLDFHDYTRHLSICFHISQELFFRNGFLQ